MSLRPLAISKFKLFVLAAVIAVAGLAWLAVESDLFGPQRIPSGYFDKFDARGE